MRIIDPGLITYHGTSFVNADNIVNTGIRIVDSAWGEGELGAGFYTATTLAGGAAYLEGNGAVLEIEVTREMRGYDVTPPPRFDWTGTGRATEIKGICTTYDYVVSRTDIPTSQIKFNAKATDGLTVVAVHFPNGAAFTRYTIEQYKEDFS